MFRIRVRAALLFRTLKRTTVLFNKMRRATLCTSHIQNNGEGGPVLFRIVVRVAPPFRTTRRAVAAPGYNPSLGVRVILNLACQVTRSLTQSASDLTGSSRAWLQHLSKAK